MSNSNIRKKENKKLKKYQELRDDMVKATVVAVVTGTPEVMTPELGDWLWNEDVCPAPRTLVEPEDKDLNLRF